MTEKFSLLITPFLVHHPGFGPPPRRPSCDESAGGREPRGHSGPPPTCRTLGGYRSRPNPDTSTSGSRERDYPARARQNARNRDLGKALALLAKTE